MHHLLLFFHVQPVNQPTLTVVLICHAKVVVACSRLSYSYVTDTNELYVRTVVAGSGPGEKFFFGPTGKGGPFRKKSRKPNYMYARWPMAASVIQATELKLILPDSIWKDKNMFNIVGFWNPFRMQSPGNLYWLPPPC